MLLALSASMSAGSRDRISAMRTSQTRARCSFTDTGRDTGTAIRHLQHLGVLLGVVWAIQATAPPSASFKVAARTSGEAPGSPLAGGGCSGSRVASASKTIAPIVSMVDFVLPGSPKSAGDHPGKSCLGMPFVRGDCHAATMSAHESGPARTAVCGRLTCTQVVI